jgi:hypothetical protein
VFLVYLGSPFKNLAGLIPVTNPTYSLKSFNSPVETSPLNVISKDAALCGESVLND